MGTFTDALKFLAAASLGISAGAILAGAVILVPFWQAMPPADFIAWYAANAQRLLYFYGPLQSAGALLAVGVALTAIFGGSSNRLFAIIAGLLAVAVFIPFFLYFQKTNASFASTTSIDDVPAELAHYALWQWARFGIVFAAFGASILAIKQPA